jgi:dolichol-phosphate mannosyltransferase
VIYFLLPAYNEETGLPPVLETISGLKFPDEEWQVVVVDDGSSDTTPDLLKNRAERIPMTVLTHESNQGLGRAMRTGLNFLGGKVTDDDAVVALDSDNTHDPSLALKMRAKQHDRDLDIVIASRYCMSEDDEGKEIGLALHRKVLSKGASFLLDSFFHVKSARDYTCGFRLYSGRIIRRGVKVYGEKLVEEKNFVCMAEILVKLAHVGAKVDEVPLTLRYDLKSGASKLRIFRTIMRYINLIWRYRALGELKKYRYP